MFRFSGAGTASETAADEPAALAPAVAALDVLSDPGAVVLAPHAVASSRTPSAAIVYLVFRDAAVFDSTVFNSKVSPERLRAHRNAAVVVIFTAYCHADETIMCRSASNSPGHGVR